MTLPTGPLHYAELTLRGSYHHTPDAVRRALAMLEPRRSLPVAELIGEPIGLARGGARCSRRSGAPSTPWWTTQVSPPSGRGDNRAGHRLRRAGPPGATTCSRRPSSAAARPAPPARAAPASSFCCSRTTAASSWIASLARASAASALPAAARRGPRRPAPLPRGARGLRGCSGGAALAGHPVVVGRDGAGAAARGLRQALEGLGAGEALLGHELLDLVEDLVADAAPPAVVCSSLIRPPLVPECE